MLGEKFFGGEIAAGEFDDVALRAAATLEKNGGGLRRIERTRGIVVSEGREKRGQFRGIGGEGIPGVAVAVVDDGAGVEDLLDPIGIFAYDADDHVDEFGKTEGLFDDGTHTDVAGVFVGVAERDLVG